MNSRKHLLFAILSVIGLMLLYNTVRQSVEKENTIAYTRFMQFAKEGQLEKVKIEGEKLIGQTTSGETLMSYLPPDIFFVSDLRKDGIEIESVPSDEQSILTTIFISWFPMILLIGVWIFFMRQMQSGGKGGGAFSFGRSRAKMTGEKEHITTFKDVAGCDEAKAEVSEIVDFLKDATRFQRLGARIPRGLMLFGSPGTGKTLLAKAIAGEAGVPFFNVSGSDFVEMFVGVGAARVRDMFEQAKKSAPCILFVDEIDAVGRQRGTGLGGGNDEREQTLNQLLVEMDGFEETLGVIVIAASNRPDVLDPALLRPGRFDRQVIVPLPDIKGREAILKVHMRNVPLNVDVEAVVLARGTPGFSGADLANLVNEAALVAGRFNSTKVTMENFEQAKEKILMGSERTTMVMPEKERVNTAYHESGHVVVAKLLEHTDPVHKVTIIPRGRALGVTMQLPEHDRFTMNREEILDSICVLLAGRAAEEIFMKQMTTGAGNDFERATQMARRMVSQWGMSDKLGTMVYGEEEGEIFIGRSIATHRVISDTTMEQVDNEIKDILDAQYKQAKKILTDNHNIVEVMAKSLLEVETLNATQIDTIIQGGSVDDICKPKGSDTDTSASANDDSSDNKGSASASDDVDDNAVKANSEKRSKRVNDLATGQSTPS